MRVLSIGIDGGDPILINKWLDKLPNFHLLQEKGVFGNCHSTKPAISAPAWVSFATGKNPGKTGVVGFIQRQTDSYQTFTVSSLNSNELTFWEIAGKLGKKVLIMNVPITYPPKLVNGVLIPGFPSPVLLKTFPPGLASELRKSGYQVDLEIGTKPNFKELKDDLISLISLRLKTLTYLVKRINPELVVIVFTATDRMQDLFYSESDENKEIESAILDIYKEIDHVVGELLELNKNGLTFINSDHGACKVKKQFNVNDWLIKKGFLTLKKNRVSPVSKIMLALGMTVQGPWYKLIDSLGIAGKFKQLLPQALIRKIPWENLPNFENLEIDWGKTLAYSYGNQNLIYLNILGREPLGIVSKKEEKMVRKKIIKELSNLEETETNMKIRVWEKEQLYNGKFLNEMPEIVFEMSENCYCPVSSVGHEQLFSASGQRQGDHSPEGIFYAYGRSIKKGLRNDCHISDLAPTILYSLGIKSPSDIDGRILFDIFFSKNNDKLQKATQSVELDQKELLRKKINDLKLKGRI